MPVTDGGRPVADGARPVTVSQVPEVKAPVAGAPVARAPVAGAAVPDQVASVPPRSPTTTCWRPADATAVTRSPVIVAPAMWPTLTLLGSWPGAATARNGRRPAGLPVTPVAISAPRAVTVLPVVVPGAGPNEAAFFQCVPSALVKPNNWPREPWASTEKPPGPPSTVVTLRPLAEDSVAT